jgi:aminopeptidase
MDPRVEKLADIMVDYSLELKKGQWVKIKAIPTAMPLVKAFFKKALEAGAHPYYSAMVDDLDEIFLKHGSDEQLTYISELQKLEIDKLDAYFAIAARDNTRFLSNVDPSKQALVSKAQKDLMVKMMERTASGEFKWVGTMFPTLSAAQDAEMSLSEYEDFVYNAGHVNDSDPVAYWKELSGKQKKMCDYLNTVKEIKVKANETQLTVKVAGRKWINCDGKFNFPDGEVFTAPIENSAEGHILYSFPACYGGREVVNVRLEFKEGKLVGFSADKNQDFLEKMVDMDEGSRFLGEFAIGTNYNITKFTKNTLFDEKLGGTIHLALGQAYPEAGGKNQSGLHWDMVCDMHEGGELTADGELIYKDGQFIKEL